MLMKRILMFAILLTVMAGLTACGMVTKTIKGTPAQPATATSAPVAATPDTTVTETKLQSLIDDLVNVDGPAAIKKAQAEIANPKVTSEEVVYAQKRIVCYQTIMAIAPDFVLPVLKTPGDTSAGILDKFEGVAETAEGLAAGIAVGLPKVDIARFETDCGWIGQRGRVIVGTIGLPQSFIPK